MTGVKNWYLIVTDVSDQNVKNWNRMQTAADLFFNNVRYTRVCYMKFDFVRIFHKSEILVRIM